jgi:hypothetical protein
LQAIDFVVMWVDGADPAWRAKKAAFSGDTAVDDRAIRYRDWGLLRYWFRAVEAFAPWVRYVWLVTDGQCPLWLETEHPKLRLIDHADFIPAQWLPAFSANPIELNLHRIRGLAEQFVFFNDDMFLLRPVRPEDFFRNGLPADDGILSPIIVESQADVGFIEANDMGVINAHFRKNQVMKQAPGRWLSVRYGRALFRSLCLMPWRHFPGFFNDHLPQPFLRGSYEAVWQAEPELLAEVCAHRFRDYKRDVNQWLIRYWQLASNGFTPISPRRGRDLRVTDSASLAFIRRQRAKMICINDSDDIQDFETLRGRFIAAFDAVLPEPSGYERREHLGR